MTDLQTSPLPRRSRLRLTIGHINLTVPVERSDRYALIVEALLKIMLSEELSDVHIRKETALPRLIGISELSLVQPHRLPQPV